MGVSRHLSNRLKILLWNALSPFLVGAGVCGLSIPLFALDWFLWCHHPHHHITELPHHHYHRQYTTQPLPNVPIHPPHHQTTAEPFPNIPTHPSTSPPVHTTQWIFLHHFQHQKGSEEEEEEQEQEEEEEKKMMMRRNDTKRRRKRKRTWRRRGGTRDEARLVCS